MKPLASNQRYGFPIMRGLCSALLLWMSSGLAAPGQDAKIVSRPLTPQEIKTYGLPATTQISGGLHNVGVGGVIYLEAQVPTGTVVTDISWTLDSAPQGSSAALAESPLGEDIPIYNPGDRAVNSVAGRMMIVPDLIGQYIVTAVVTTDTETLTLTRKLAGGTYAGVGEPGLAFHDPPQCALCHADKFAGWKTTNHSKALTYEIDGLGSDHFASHCVRCHSLGYDTSPLADNGGFDDIARLVEWTFPEMLEPGNWDAMHDDLKAVSNVQCESCHGAGSAHSRSGGNPELITVSTSSGDCGQCHDSEPYHTKNAQWNLSAHAVATRYPTGENRASCVKCHSGVGYIDFADGLAQGEFRTEYEAIVCATCHDPHTSSDEGHQLRVPESIELVSGDMIQGGGKGRVCMSCHVSRRDAVATVEQSTSTRIDPHRGPQTDMLAGRNAYEYGRMMPSSGHMFAVEDSCVTCHMHEVPGGHMAKNMAGEHTFKAVWDGGTPDDHADDVDMVGSCTQCHGPIESFDFARQDYDGDGLVEGVQTEVAGLMNRVAMLLPPVGEPEIDITSDFTVPQRAAAFNYSFVENDGSMGVHNTSYTVNILKAAIAELTGDGTIIGDSDFDCLPDDWEREHFGEDLMAQDADGDADMDGLTNAFELKLGTNPTLADSDNDGFSDLDELHVSTDPNNAESNPTVGRSQIFKAAELVFFTEPEKTYQVQSVSRIGTGTWVDVGDPVTGTGEMLQYFISTRESEQGYYRIVEVTQ